MKINYSLFKKSLGAKKPLGFTGGIFMGWVNYFVRDRKVKKYSMAQRIPYVIRDRQGAAPGRERGIAD
jgi:hypothetical protein